MCGVLFFVRMYMCAVCGVLFFVVVWCCVVLACCREHVVVLVVRVSVCGVWCGVVCVNVWGVARLGARKTPPCSCPAHLRV